MDGRKTRAAMEPIFVEIIPVDERDPFGTEFRFGDELGQSWTARANEVAEFTRDLCELLRQVGAERNTDENT